MGTTDDGCQQAMMWGGSDEPCALCQCASLGAINLKNNKAVASEVCQLLSEVLSPLLASTLRG